MKSFKKDFILLITLFFLSGCNIDKKEEQYRTIDFFNKNKDVRDKRIKECATLKTMSIITAKDCSNAEKSATTGVLPDTSGWVK